MNITSVKQKKKQKTTPIEKLNRQTFCKAFSFVHSLIQLKSNKINVNPKTKF